ncbi:MAG: tryptophan-rich sensory protein [Micrococcales bacterium]|nr:tryptophan-rich sensory protein [Micrococcales bacterium]
MNSTHPRNPDDSAADPNRSSGRTVLVTGATGYIGGLLVPRLLDAGWSVRVLSRSADRLADKPWATAIDVVEGDATKRVDLDRAMAGVDVAYFLIHSMDGGGDFAKRDRALATGFAAAAERAGVGRIVYLGGLHPDGELSEHLASRVEVGEIFLASSVPAACLQAAVVVGDGSISFAMLRHLTERLPAMIAPKWLQNRIQPIAVDDVLHYLVGAADLPSSINRTLDIGGPEVLTYAEMIQRFAAVTGRRRRLILPVPVLTPGLASHWIGTVTPVNVGVAKPLIGSLVHEVVCKEGDIDTLVGPPPGGATGFDNAVHRAMRTVQPQRGPQTLAATAAATALAAVIGSAATTPDSHWYRSLDLPSWQPPTLAFPVVWTALYADIAGTSASVIRSLEDSGRSDEARAFRRALGVNLALNAGWSVLFWRSRRLDLATVEAGLLTLSSADLARRARAVGDGHAAWLAPYAAWCGFATVLTAAIARRNPSA